MRAAGRRIAAAALRYAGTISRGYRAPGPLTTPEPRAHALHDLATAFSPPARDAGGRGNDLRMVSVFLWRSGKLPRYLELVRRGDKRGRETYLEAAFDQPLKDIEPAWRSYLRDARANRAEIARVPPSTVFRDKAEYEAFVTAQRLEVQY